MRHTCTPDSKCNVLLVEDTKDHEDMIRALIAAYGRGGFTLCSAETWGEGRQRIAQHAKPGVGGLEIILLDMHLPDCSGIELVRDAVAAAPTVPLVVITSSSDLDLIEAVYDAGAQKYLLKSDIVSSPTMFCDAMRESVLRQRFRNRIQDECERIVAELSAQQETETRPVSANEALAKLRKARERMTALARLASTGG